MKKLILIVPVLLSVSFAANTQGINFDHSNFASVCARAKAEGKLVFIDIYTSWCGPCKHMAETVFTKENVGAFFNSHFISYKIDAEKGEGKAIAAKYNVRIYPTYLFLDYKGAVFNRYVGSCADTVFLGIAAKARQEFINPNSMPRMKAQYASKKKDTAFLRLYIEKLRANETHTFEEIEQYLSVQTAMRPDSREMMEFLTKYPRELYCGGRAAQILEKYSESFRQMADSGQRWQLEIANSTLLSNTRIYAIESKSEAIMKNYIAEGVRQASSGQPFSPQGARLDFYASTENWTKFGPLANHCLDSICAQLKPVDGSKEETAMRRGAYIVSDNAKIYRDHFTNEKDVVEKALRWLKAALQTIPNNAQALTFYANLLYESNDTANAISYKMKALNSMPQISLHRNIVETNLAHMQKGESLEEE